MYSIALADQTDFEGWRKAARHLAMAGVPASETIWRVAGDDMTGDDLFAAAETPLPQIDETAAFSVSRDFVARLRTAIHHRDADRFSFLYRLLLRVWAEKNLLKIASDPDIQRLEAMEKSVRRDAHKMHAFVRFRQIEIAGKERFVAWFEPDHYIVEREADFFVKRFTGMSWTILSPWRSISWNGEALSIAPGARKEDAPSEDAAEELWRTYFGNIFNPARLKVKAMQAEMPKKYWRNLPEASLIPAMIAGAGRAAEQMIERAPTLPAAHHAGIQQRHWSGGTEETMAADEAKTLAELHRAAKGCTSCALYKEATQTVFGEGPDDADIVFVGEQPGDQEDLAGRPFVGPAGQMFDATLAEVGIDRQRVYVTNAVKHFKFEPRGKRRIHQRPNVGEVQACRWWVDREIAMIRPKLTVALGATAAHSLLGKAIPVTKARGQVIERDDGLAVFITVHPSFLLRIPDRETAARERRLFADDLAAVRDLMKAA